MELIKEEHSVAEYSNFSPRINEEDKGEEYSVMQSHEKYVFNGIEDQQEKKSDISQDKQTGNQK